MASPGRGGIMRYFREAFLYRWNLLAFFGAMGFAALSPAREALAPIIMGLELAYLAGLSAIPRFRTAVDAKAAAQERGHGVARALSAPAQHTLQRMIESLPTPALRRFLGLRQRCFDMREIAAGVRGAHGASGHPSGDVLQESSLDRLLFLFLKLLVSQAGLERFLSTTSERELELRLQDMQQRLGVAQKAGVAGDERIVRSLTDSVADAQLRLENYRKSMKDSEFVGIELDRIETKIRTLVEMAVSRQDPDTLSVQVTAAADSMRQTEEAVNHLQHLTGLESELEEPPAILAADMRRVLSRGA
ncbi:MAG: hypothetical protein ACT4R6_02660 [Gemmatimonadaceae bacterium]